MQSIFKSTFRLYNKTKLYERFHNIQGISTLKTQYNKQILHLSRKEFNSRRNQKQFDDNVYSISEEILYKPKERITFTNGKADVFIYNNRFFTLFLLSCFAYGAYYSGKKLYHIHERGYFGILFYTIIFLLCIKYMPKTAKTTSTVIKRLSLNQDGKSIEIETYKMGLIKTLNRYSIANIARPVNPQESNMGGFGFPILIDEKIYILSRFGTRLLPEVMPVILNGKYIDTKDFNNDNE